jgi:hypothetical protein
MGADISTQNKQILDEFAKFSLSYRSLTNYYSRIPVYSHEINSIYISKFKEDVKQTKLDI